MQTTKSQNLNVSVFVSLCLCSKSFLSNAPSSLQRNFSLELAHHFFMFRRRELVRFMGHDRRRQEILSRRRRRSLPFEARQIPWVRLGDAAVAQRPSKIDQRNH